MSQWHYNWFSNMEPFDEPLVHEGISYLAVENFYQAQKVKNMDMKLFISELDPRKSKTHIRKFNIQPHWTTKEKLAIMEYALNHKFRLDTSWGRKLLETGDEEIVEWNNWGDVWWGKDLETKEGLNHLGILLMKIRNNLKLQQIL